MEVVSATKMRRAQQFALRARPFALASLDMMKNLLVRTPALPFLLRARPVARIVLLVVTSDKGLAGAFNANVLKKAETLVQEKQAAGISFTLITVGKKAKDYFERRKVSVQKNFWGFGDYSMPEETSPVAEMVIKGFLDGSWDEVHAVYTNFRTTLLQQTEIEKILPATKEGIESAINGMLPEQGRFADLVQSSKENRYVYEYIFEPSAEEILSMLVPHLIRIHIHHIILESNASEHSARMVAMKNASDNAKDLIGNLALVYNKVRQAGITQELAEITSGKEALES